MKRMVKDNLFKLRMEGLYFYFLSAFCAASFSLGAFALRFAMLNDLFVLEAASLALMIFSFPAIIGNAVLFAERVSRGA